MIRDATVADAPAIAAIYNHYVEHTIITFETTAVADEDIAARIAATTGGGYPWLVAEESDAVVGYAYATQWSGRCAYRYSAESSVYLAPDAAGRGLGSALYGRLIPQLAGAGMHVVIGGIALPNAPSIALHEKVGMRKVAHFCEVGHKFGEWIDVGYWQMELSS